MRTRTARSSPSGSFVSPCTCHVHIQPVKTNDVRVKAREGQEEAGRLGGGELNGTATIAVRAYGLLLVRLVIAAFLKTNTYCVRRARHTREHTVENKILATPTTTRAVTPSTRITRHNETSQDNASHCAEDRNTTRRDGHTQLETALSHLVTEEGGSRAGDLGVELPLVTKHASVARRLLRCACPVSQAVVAGEVRRRFGAG